MTLTELRYFLALAQTKQFRKAADCMHVSQPTLSVAIQKLEKKINTALFERHKSFVTLTSLGERFQKQAMQVLEEVDKLEGLLKEDPLSEPLKLGMIYTTAPYLFPKLVLQLKKTAPQMPLVLEENFTLKLREKLLSGELDAIVVALPFSVPNTVFQPLYEEPFYLLLPKKHPLASKERISKKDLNGESLLLLGEGHCFRSQILEACPQCDPSFGHSKTIQGTTSLETLREMVSVGLGVTLLPASATVQKEHKKNWVVKAFDKSPPKRTMALVWRKSFPRQKAIQTLQKAIAGAAITRQCVL